MFLIRKIVGADGAVGGVRGERAHHLHGGAGDGQLGGHSAGGVRVRHRRSRHPGGGHSLPGEEGGAANPRGRTRNQVGVVVIIIMRA